MVICSSFFHFPVPIKLHSGVGAGSKYQFQTSKFQCCRLSTELVSQVARSEAESGNGWSFIGGSKLYLKPRSKRLLVPCKAEAAVYASLWTSSQIANNVFTLGTAAVLPFYTLMVVAPKAEMTKKSMESCLPYVVFGTVYAYLLYLSWTPGTLRAMFASKYWMPELSAIASLFTNEMSLSSAWIHLLAIDLFAARQVYQEGLAKDIETRHSIHPRFKISYPYSPSTNVHFVPRGTHNTVFGPRPVNPEDFARGSRISIRPKSGKFMYAPNVCATMCATALFNLGTAIVLPLYTLMIIAPKQKMTKKTMESHVPYVALGLVYAYVLALSWTPQHLGALFGGKSMMPDFSRVGVLFFSELSATAAWIHLLLVDLFAARKVLLDGLENEIETRHSITLCLFFGPVGILSHVVTKALTRMPRS